MSHASSIFPNISTLIVFRPTHNPLERSVSKQIFLLIGKLNNPIVFFFFNFCYQTLNKASQQVFQLKIPHLMGVVQAKLSA